VNHVLESTQLDIHCNYAMFSLSCIVISIQGNQTNPFCCVQSVAVCSRSSV